MGRVVGGDHDGVHGRVGDQLERIGERPRSPGPGGGGSANRVGVGDGGDVRARHGRGERVDVGRAHHPRPDDADPDAHVT